jgi:hypothetical protein
MTLDVEMRDLTSLTHSVNSRKPPPSAVAVSIISGSYLSGFLAVKGAVSAGHDPTAGWPFPDVNGLVIFIGGAIACPILAFCLVKLLSRILPKTSYLAIFTTLVISPLLAVPMGAAAYRWHFRPPVRDPAKEVKSHQDNLAKNEALLARLISDPEIALRERWFEWKPGNELLRYLFIKSLGEPSVPYSADQLARIYHEAPEARVLVVAHPACDPSFLENHWSHALQQAEAGNREILTAIVSNPKTPQALLEKLESSSLFSQSGEPDALRQMLDTRLHGDQLVMTRHQMIKATTATYLIMIHADSDMKRSCEWNNATRSVTLESRKEDSPDGSVVYFHGFSEDNSEYRVTKRFEIREGRRNFQTLEEVARWIRQQSERIPTVYRNDGLLVSCAMDPAKNQLTVEIWQILIGMIKPSSLPGGDDTNISLKVPDPAK